MKVGSKERMAREGSGVEAAPSGTSGGEAEELAGIGFPGGGAGLQRAELRAGAGFRLSAAAPVPPAFTPALLPPT